MTTDTTQAKALDYSGRPLAEGDPVAYVSHDPIGLTTGRIRVISPESICIQAGPYLVTFNGVPASLGIPRPRPIEGTVRRDANAAEPLRYPLVALQPTQDGA